MRRLGEWDRWSSRLRLFVVVCGAAGFMTAWVFQQQGPWAERLLGALLAAFAPIVVAWPFLARTLRRPRRLPFLRLHPGSLGELDFLRRAGAI